MSDATATQASGAPLHQVGAYRRRFGARVTASEGDVVQLDRSAFYPGGGGQPRDHGTVTDGARTRQLTGARVKGGGTVYELDGPVPPVGAERPGLQAGGGTHV
ncbi:MAG: hypothetical protein WBC33_04760 [Conexibacter sp.]